MYVRQPKMLGLGHAVLCAKNAVGREPFAVLLADDLVDSETPCLRQMVDVFCNEDSSVVCVEPVCSEDFKRYGMVDPVGEVKEKYTQIKGIIEKPLPENSPSNLGVIGRYILTPDIFRTIEETEPGKNGELQITDALMNHAKKGMVLAYKFKGDRFDCGSVDGFVEATNYFYNKQKPQKTSKKETKKK